MPEQYLDVHIPQREWQEITAHILLGHVVKPHQDQRVSEKDGVVKKGLSRHQHETEKRTATMFVHDRVPDFPPRRMRARSNARGPDPAIAAVSAPRPFRSHTLALHFGNEPFRLEITSLGHG